MTPHESADQVLELRLLRYALTAGVALACQVPSQAEVIFTPSNVIYKGGHGKFDIDLDNDGSANFSLVTKKCGGYLSYDYSVPCLVVYGATPSNQIALDGIRKRCAAALRKKTRVGAGPSFQAFAIMATDAYGFVGNFGSVRNRFLAVKILINGEVHFGWIGFRSVFADYGTVTVSFAGYAYETTPNTPIVTGNMGEAAATYQPTSVEILASGHTGIEQRRKRNAP